MKTSPIKNLTPAGRLRHPLVWVREWTSKQEQEQPVKSVSQSKSLGGAPYIPEDALGTADVPSPPKRFLLPKIINLANWLGNHPPFT